MEKYSAALTHIALAPTLLAAFVIVVVNTLWYSPWLFGKSFTRHSSIRPGDIRPADRRRNIVLGIATALLEAWLLAVAAGHMQSAMGGLFAAVVFVWFFIMLQQLKGFTFRREPFALFLLTTLRTLLSLLAGAGVFYFWSTL